MCLVRSAHELGLPRRMVAEKAGHWGENDTKRSIICAFALSRESSALCPQAAVDRTSRFVPYGPPNVQMRSKLKVSRLYAYAKCVQKYTARESWSTLIALQGMMYTPIRVDTVLVGSRYEIHSCSEHYTCSGDLSLLYSGRTLYCLARL